VLNGLADVMVCTECELGSLPNGHVVDGGADWGYPLPSPGRRKVALWSSEPWTAVAHYEHDDLPGGRAVAATTSTAIGPLRVVGVCIPWRDAHVTTGRRDRSPWEDHAAFLRHLPRMLEWADEPLILAGDFNQRIPRVRQPVALADALARALRGLSIPTAGSTALGHLIDHVALGSGLAASSVELLPDRSAHGPLSDHVGAVVSAVRT
jgi:endonuclease/exonuclease/phosphatase family metal-dependent hydrolase